MDTPREIGGRVKATELARRYRAARTIDARDFVVLPGLVDGHVHVTA